MNNFDWLKFINKKVAVRCKTKEATNDFLKYCDKQFLKLSGGDNALKCNNWNTYQQRTCYAYKYRLYCADYQYYNERSYKIIDWEIDVLIL